MQLITFRPRSYAAADHLKALTMGFDHRIEINRKLGLYFIVNNGMMQIFLINLLRSLLSLAL